MESNPIIEKEIPRGINEILSQREGSQQNLREDSNKENEKIEQSESIEDVVLDWRAGKSAIFFLCEKMSKCRKIQVTDGSFLKKKES